MDAPLTSLTSRPGHPPQSGLNRPPQGESGFADSSGPLFSMYLQLAEDEDKKMTESWKGDADGILIFVSRHSTVVPLRTFTPSPKTGLFSAAVAALVAVSVQDLKPSSQDISAFYLANIYQILNGSQIVMPPSLSDPSTFSPPTSAVWVNSLWFLSLLISLTCALLATLLQQWARRYMKVTQTRYSPHKRARIRAFFAEGVENLHLPWAVEALPALLHLSLFLFFAGLTVFLFDINHTVFKMAISWVGFCTVMYMYITFMPMFRHDSPYYAPLSSSAWYLYTGMWFTLFRILRWIATRYNPSGLTWRRTGNLRRTYWQRISRGLGKEFEETALKAPPEVDGRALMWTYESLDEDHELEQFFSGIPGFCSSKVLDDPQSSLDSLRSQTVAQALNGFLERTWSPNLVPEIIKIRRIAICVRAIDAAHLSNAAHEILDEFFPHRPASLRAVELGHSLMSWDNNDDRRASLFTQGIIAFVIAKVPEHDERWFSLTTQHLGISEHDLRSYLDHGNSVLLANLIHFTRQFFHNFLMANWEGFPLLDILRRLSYNVQNTLPGLQHDFCGLWNEIVLNSRHRGHDLILDILKGIHPTYVALHPDSTPHNEYQLCSILSHRIAPASTLNEVEGDRTAETDHVPTTNSPAPHHHDAVPPVTEYITPSPTSNLDHAIPHVVVREQSRNGVLDNITPVTSLFHPTPLETNQLSDGTAADPVQVNTDPSVIPSLVNTGSRSTSSHGTTSRPTRNMTTTTPSFLPDTAPPPIPLLIVSPDPPAPHMSADPTVNQSVRSPDDGSTSRSSSRTPTSFPLSTQVVSGFDSNPTTGTVPLDTPQDTLDPNRRVISQSFTSSSPDGAGYSLRPEDGDNPSASFGPSQ